jgi:hypothetical protein
MKKIKINKKALLIASLIFSKGVSILGWFSMGAFAIALIDFAVDFWTVGGLILSIFVAVAYENIYHRIKNA